MDVGIIKCTAESMKSVNMVQAVILFLPAIHHILINGIQEKVTISAFKKIVQKFMVFFNVGKIMGQIGYIIVISLNGKGLDIFIIEDQASKISSLEE